MNEKRLYIMLGLPGSGKSTYVDANLVPYGCQLLSPDALRQAHGHKYYGPLEAQIHGMLHTMGRALMLRGHHVVVDECTTRPSYVQRWRRLALDHNYRATALYINTPKAICIERRRESDFPLDVIELKYRELSANINDIKALFAEKDWMEITWKEMY